MNSSVFRLLPALTRWKVSLAVAFSAFTAMVMADSGFSVLHLFPFTGILVLAAGASALNQVQESDTDARMDRTSGRPIPSRALSRSAARTIAYILIIAGTVLLAVIPTPSCLLLGLGNILWYNGVYTPLKKKTAFAVVPGALTGALPVYMGWTAMGGSIFAPVPALFAFFIFLWQMPHFWLLMLEYGNDYRKAGLPVMTDMFSLRQFKSIIMGWMVASAAGSLLLVHFGMAGHVLIRMVLVLMNIAMALFFLLRFFLRNPASYRPYFIGINIFMMAVMLLLLADRLIRIPLP